MSRSSGVLNSHGIDHAIFPNQKDREHTIFGQIVSEHRYEKVWLKLHESLHGWFPKFNNAFELYTKNGSQWEKVKASEICHTLKDHNEPYEAWKDMPQEAIDYLVSLPEFNAENFKRVTGIDVSKPKQDIEIDGRKFSVETIKEALKNHTDF